ncbi:MAG: hypothetical protein M1821_006763 [Bathelium mastoideum]|nr:MAG: hypothetical protein M1821_006763 [Bathelium mastoideum]
MDTDPDCRSCQGWTALQEACAITTGNATAIVELLIASGADVNAKPGNGFSMTALQAACKAGNAEVADILLHKGAELDAEAGLGISALAAASMARHFGIVKKLLDLGADINQLTYDCFRGLGPTALLAAVGHGDLEMIDYLVQRGAELQAEHGFLALKSAVGSDHVNVASRLLELGANVNAEVNGEAPVHFVRSVEMLNLLVAHGVQVNRSNSQPGGRTALQRAARTEDLDLVKELMRSGSDIHAPGPEIRGATNYHRPLPMIKLLNDEDEADLNEARSSEGYTSLEEACLLVAWSKGSGLEEKPTVNLVKFLLERGAKITPFTLHVAAAFGHAALVRLLLRNGARIEEPSDISIASFRWGDDRPLGSTVIETAQLNDNQDLVTMLKTWVDSTQKHTAFSHVWPNFWSHGSSTANQLA